MYSIYFLISENKKKTYVGLTSNLADRRLKHKKGGVKSTKNFGNFFYKILEQVNTIDQARLREKYWKSAAGRRKLKNIYRDITKKDSSSSG